MSPRVGPGQWSGLTALPAAALVFIQFGKASSEAGSAQEQSLAAQSELQVIDPSQSRQGRTGPTLGPLYPAVRYGITPHPGPDTSNNNTEGSSFTGCGDQTTCLWVQLERGDDTPNITLCSALCFARTVSRGLYLSSPHQSGVL